MQNAESALDDFTAWPQAPSTCHSPSPPMFTFPDKNSTKFPTWSFFRMGISEQKVAATIATARHKVYHCGNGIDYFALSNKSALLPNISISNLSSSPLVSSKFLCYVSPYRQLCTGEGKWPITIIRIARQVLKLSEKLLKELKESLPRKEIRRNAQR